ncbi:type III-A CRISPR-associated RAMP protein Csm4 [Desulfolithobacter sp.]
MKLYAITIQPESPFGTPLKGDTLFGSFCWQAALDRGLLTGGLDHWIESYRKKPFLVLSSAFPQVVDDNSDITYALPRPALPPSWLEPDGTGPCAERLKKRKEKKSRRWLLTGSDLHIDLCWDNLIDDRELGSRICAMLGTDNDDGGFVRFFEQSHNTINRLTSTTGKGFFSPYSMSNFVYRPGMELVLFALVNEQALNEESLLTGLERIGSYGYGRDASTGLGRFGIGECDEITLPLPENANALLTLGPCVPRPEEYEQAWFSPFTRFGRHGSQLLHTGKPFKNPVVMADEGAVFLPKTKEQLSKRYMGQAVTGVSKAQEKAVCQGYTIVVPMKLPVKEA